MFLLQRRLANQHLFLEYNFQYKYILLFCSFPGHSPLHNPHIQQVFQLQGKKNHPSPVLLLEDSLHAAVLPELLEAVFLLEWICLPKALNFFCSEEKRCSSRLKILDSTKKKLTTPFALTIVSELSKRNAAEVRLLNRRQNYT